MNGCGFCTKAKQMFAKELRSGKMVEKDASEAPEDVPGFPTFQCVKTGKKHSGLPQSKDDLYEVISAYEMYENNPYGYNAMVAHPSLFVQSTPTGTQYVKGTCADRPVGSDCPGGPEACVNECCAKACMGDAQCNRECLDDMTADVDPTPGKSVVCKGSLPCAKGCRPDKTGKCVKGDLSGVVGCWSSDGSRIFDMEGLQKTQCDEPNCWGSEGSCAMELLGGEEQSKPKDDGKKSKDEEKDGEKSKDEEKDGEKSKDEEKDGDKKALKLSFLEISLIVGICILLLFLLVMVFRRRR